MRYPSEIKNKFILFSFYQLTILFVISLVLDDEWLSSENPPARTELPTRIILTTYY